MHRRAKMAAGTVLAVIITSICAGAFEYRNTPQNLQKLMETMLQASAKGDYGTAAALTQALVPTRERASIALKKGVSGEVLDKLMKLYSRTPDRSDTLKWAKMLTRKPERSVVRIYGADTEEIAAQAKGSIVWKEFPGGAVRAARTILKPGMIFYEVKRTEPGKTRGYKQHLFFWDGKEWCMLGPVWRALRKQPASQRERLRQKAHDLLPGRYSTAPGR